MTITDSSTEKTGAVVGISDGAHGGAVITVVGGTLTLQGGTVTGNTTTAQGGGIFVKNGTVTVCDGAAITGNTAAEGGGIYATGTSTVNIYGGMISNNTATSTEMDRGGITPQGGGWHRHSGQRQAEHVRRDHQRQHGVWRRRRHWHAA